MEKHSLEELLQEVSEGTVSPEQALLSIKEQPFADLGYAKVDLHRQVRQGAGEVVYGAGKTPEQIAGIVASLRTHGQDRVLITRLSRDQHEILKKLTEYDYYPEARIAIAGGMPEVEGTGTILVCTGGTSDIPVAEEAALTAEFLGNKVIRCYDVGVAGLHRLMSHMDDVMSARVIIAVAGMEGALASVVGGLADCPVIAVPTSVGYGASFGGISALLSMLNSCASGVSVVNIDNGFGAGYQASMINRH